jgi:hypothetical protein
MHLVEKIFLITSWTLVFISVWFIPKEKAAHASVIFLITQLFTWICGLIVVESGWLEYPVRELAKANATSFSFEYFTLPVITIFVVLYYPRHKPVRIRLFYIGAISSVLTTTEYFVEKYTLILHYHTWRWYWTWISVTLLFYLVMYIYRWFFKYKT